MPRGETAWAFITNFVLNHKPLAMTENLLSQLVIISPASILTPKFGPTFILANHLQHYASTFIKFKCVKITLSLLGSILQSEFDTATRYFAPRGDCFPAADCY